MTVKGLTYRYATAQDAMTAINTLGAFDIRAGLTKCEGEVRPWVVTITRWPFSPTVRLVDYHDVEPHEDDFQESRWWDEGGQAGLDAGYRRRHTLNDPD